MLYCVKYAYSLRSSSKAPHALADQFGAADLRISARSTVPAEKVPHFHTGIHPPQYTVPRPDTPACTE